MRILSIDTSSKRCSVAITEDNNEIIELHSDDEKTHSVKLMPMIDEAFKKTNLTLDDIGLLACAIGPRSFTGIRIGIATIKAFADAKSIPVVGVSSLEGLAYNVISNSSAPLPQLSNTLYCSLIDAKHNNVYCGIFRYYNNSLNKMTDFIAEDIDNVIAKINTIINSFDNQFNNICFVGDGSCVYKDKINNEFNKFDVNFAEEDLNKANSTSIAISAFTKYNNGEYGDSNSITPLYLRKSQAERNIKSVES